MLYYIYIGNNRIIIDHLSKVTGGMFGCRFLFPESGKSH